MVDEVVESSGTVWVCCSPCLQCSPV